MTTGEVWFALYIGILTIAAMGVTLAHRRADRRIADARMDQLTKGQQKIRDAVNQMRDDGVGAREAAERAARYSAEVLRVSGGSPPGRGSKSHLTPIPADPDDLSRG